MNGKKLLYSYLLFLLLFLFSLFFIKNIKRGSFLFILKMTVQSFVENIWEKKKKIFISWSTRGKMYHFPSETISKFSYSPFFLPFAFQYINIVTVRTKQTTSTRKRLNWLFKKFKSTWEQKKKKNEKYRASKKSNLTSFFI